MYSNPFILCVLDYAERFAREAVHTAFEVWYDPLRIKPILPVSRANALSTWSRRWFCTSSIQYSHADITKITVCALFWRKLVLGNSSRSSQISQYQYFSCKNATKLSEKS